MQEVYVLEGDDKLIVTDQEASQAMIDFQLVPDAEIIDGYYTASAHYAPVFRTVMNILNLKFITHRLGYTPKGVYKIWEHQKPQIDLMLKHKRAFNLAEMGCSKTASTLWAFDILKSLGAVNKMLVLTPLSTVYPAWINDARLTIPHLKITAAIGSKSSRVNHLMGDSDIIVTNHDAVKVVPDALHDFVHRNKVMLVVDEATAYSHVSSARTTEAITLAQKAERVYALTATPLAQHVEKAHGLMRVVGSEFGRIPLTLSDFRRQYCVKITQNKWEQRPDAVQTLQANMRPAVYMSLRDVNKDIPPNIFMERRPQLSKEQATAYNQLRREMMYEHQDGRSVTAINAGVLLTKVMQVACGVVIGNEGTLTLPPKNKLQEVISIIEESASKVIVLAPFTAVIDYLVEELGKEYGAAAICVIDGRVTGEKRNAVVEAFQDPSSAVRVMVAHPQPLCFGLTLVEADTLVWFAPTLHVEHFIQANARHVRPGQKRTTRTVVLSSTSEETRIYRNAQNGTLNNQTFVDVFNAFLLNRVEEGF